jgi:perosamine synthetase
MSSAAMSTQPTFIPLCAPEIRGNEWRYVKECLDGGWVSSVGDYVVRFEKDLARFTGARFGVATSSGTAALHVALLVAGVEPEDEVIVSGLTFIAPANAVRYVGAWPVFIDADPDYWQMDSQKLRDFLQHGCTWRNGALYNRENGRRVRALVPVHILGHPADMDPILEVARRYGLVVIEDATESLGATYRGKAVGHLGDLACFSFNGNKVITTGGGGIILTDREDWAIHARHLTTQAKSDPLEYVHDEVGFNYRLTNIQAAVGVAQLELLADYVAAKRKIAARYREGLAGIRGIELPREATWAESIWWLYTIQVREAEAGISSRALMKVLHEAGIQSRPLWQPLHLSPAHSASPRLLCPNAAQLHREGLSLPSSVGLLTNDQDRVIDAIVKAVR